MENKKAAVLVLAILAAVAITASGVYAMGRQAVGTGSSYPIAGYGSGVSPWMMGGSSGQAGGMMGGYGMMRDVNGMGSMYQYMQQYMSRYWNSTYTP